MFVSYSTFKIIILTLNAANAQCVISVPHSVGSIVVELKQKLIEIFIIIILLASSSYALNAICVFNFYISFRVSRWSN